MVGVRGKVLNDCGEITVGGPIKIIWVADDSTKFDGFKWVGFFKGDVVSNNNRVFRH